MAVDGAAAVVDAVPTYFGVFAALNGVAEIVKTWTHAAML